MKQINELYKDDKPREKLLKKGPLTLKNYELIALILGSGFKGMPVLTIAKAIEKFLKKEGVEGITVKKLLSINGIGSAKACQLTAAFELARRHYESPEAVTITHSRDIAEILKDYSTKNQEHFITVTLDGANTVIKTRVVFIGTLNRSLVHPREVFAPAFADRAASIVIAHNHPSGNKQPSLEDIEMTQKLMKAGEILGIDIIDHVILTKNGHYSFHGNGKI
jgi:DNA repair protein RadC